MEILILDKLLRPIDVVDKFESMIWAERYSDIGDFKLVTISTRANRNRFVPGTWIVITDSRRIMEIETVDDAVSDEGRPTLEISGFEITGMLKRRLVMSPVSGPGLSPNWYFSMMTPGTIMRYMFDQICVTGALMEEDEIPFYDSGTLYPADTIPEPSTPINWEQEPNTLYAAVKELADIYDLGFRMYRDPFVSKIYFDVYSGSDRTTAQTTLPPVVFSRDMENLQNTREFTSVSNEFNVVRVLYTYTDEVTELENFITFEVYDNPISPPEGFDRKVKLVTVTSIPEEITDIPEYLIQCGLDELAKSRPVVAFDGEVTKTSQYIYEQDYYLGDIVEVRSDIGGSAYMRVNEYIHVQDREGQRSYPTFTTKVYINPGTWMSPKYDIEWDAMGDDEVWDNQ